MPKKIIVTLAAAILIILFFRLGSTSAQKYNRDQAAVDFSPLEEKIDKIISMLPDKSSQDAANREIIAKLDQVLQNQQKIFEDLDVIKVRASVKR